MTHHHHSLTGAEVLLKTLAEHEINVIYLNPGTDTAPIAQAAEELASRGSSLPRIVLCPHETVALAAAQSHFMATGKLAGVFVHVDVGTQNLGSMVHNASKANAGVIIMAGLTPQDEYGEVPGSRDHGVHWLQDVPDQAGIVRQYVKATFNPPSGRYIQRTLSRAINIASAPAAGPVYLTFAREVLMEKVATFDRIHTTTVFPPGPSDAAIATSLKWLQASSNPVFITSRLGQDPQAVKPFEAVVETLQAHVLDTDTERMNFPSDHPRFTTDDFSILEQADLVVIIDCPVPWPLNYASLHSECRVLHVELDPVQSTIPNWGFPADVRIYSQPIIWLEAVLKHLRSTKKISSTSSPIRPQNNPVASRTPNHQVNNPLTAGDVIRSIGAHLLPDDVVIEECTTSRKTLQKQLPRTIPGTLFRAGGSGLGWATGALLGIKIAQPEAFTVAFMGDGSFIFSAPTAGLLALKKEKIGGLIVILDNKGYAASSKPIHDLYPHRQDGQPWATAFYQDVSFAGIAQACGAVGVHVTNGDELRKAVPQAVTTARKGELVVLQAIISSPWITSD